MSEVNNQKKWIYFLIGIICIVFVVVLIILFFLQGDTNIVGEGEITIAESFTCEGEGLWYPFFTFDNSNGKSIKINVLLDDKSKLDTINLVYRLKYDSKELSERSEAINFASFGKSLASDSLNAESFESRFVDMEDAMQMTLYAKAKELNGVTAKYFLLNGSNDLKRDTLTKIYNDQGLSCVILNKQEGDKGGK